MRLAIAKMAKMKLIIGNAYSATIASGGQQLRE
jgi:hypothetical protein